MAGRTLDHFNWAILIVTLAIVAIGLMCVYSATWSEGQVGLSPEFRRQAMYAVAGVIVLVLTLLVDYRLYERLAWIIYGANCALLVALLFFGRVVSGSVRWLDFGVGNLQPSETAKLALIVVLAKYFHGDVRPLGFRIRDLARPALLTAIPAGLIFVQPDLGSTLFQVGLFGCVALFAGIRWRSLAVVAAACVIIAPLGYLYALDDYQRDRIHTFLQPEHDPRGKGYQTIQARYAIGAGRVTGTGFLQGTQTHQGFIPEQHTDFIFTVLAEEWGLVGGLTLLSLYFALIVLGLIAAAQAKERFGVFLAVGASAVVFLQVVINLGGVLGLLPLTGITLPLMSFGGSSMLTVMICVGLLLNISMRRYMF